MPVNDVTKNTSCPYLFPAAGVRIFAPQQVYYITKQKADMALQVGDKAPDFTLRNSEKEQVSLKQFRGKNTIILFFPMAFTGVCTKELCAMRDSIADYEKLDAQILAISVDSVFSLGKWKEEQNFNFPLLSDFNKTVSKKYDTIYKDFVFEMKGVSKRSAFVVDGAGIIRYAEVLENAGEIPNFDAVKQTLQSLN
jgi:glutaredoxin-dependent peroxiredoxin